MTLVPPMNIKKVKQAKHNKIIFVNKSLKSCYRMILCSGNEFQALTSCINYSTNPRG